MIKNLFILIILLDLCCVGKTLNDDVVELLIIEEDEQQQQAKNCNDITGLFLSLSLFLSSILLTLFFIYLFKNMKI